MTDADAAARPTVVELLEFDRTHPKHDGRKTEAIRHTFGVTVPRYYQLLLDAIETREARRHDALLVRQIHERIHGGARRRLGLLRRKP